MGFTVDPKSEYHDVDALDMHTAAHTALDHILNTMEERGVNGGEGIIEAQCLAGHIHLCRLTFCNWDGQQICAFCEGTGAAKQTVSDN